MIFVFEGLDGCGKTTQIKRLAELTKAHVIKFPTYDMEPEGVCGRVVGMSLAHEWAAYWTEPKKHTAQQHAKLNAIIRQALFAANKREMAETIQVANEEGKAVIIDRYIQSAYAYGVAEHLDLQWLRRIHAGLPAADHYFLLDSDYDTMLARRPGSHDLYEKRGKAYFDAVRRNYHTVWSEKTFHQAGESWHIVDGRANVDEVEAAIHRCLAASTIPSL